MPSFVPLPSSLVRKVMLTDSSFRHGVTSLSYHSSVNTHHSSVVTYQVAINRPKSHGFRLSANECRSSLKGRVALCDMRISNCFWVIHLQMSIGKGNGHHSCRSTETLRKLAGPEVCSRPRLFQCVIPTNRLKRIRNRLRLECALSPATTFSVTVLIWA